RVQQPKATPKNAVDEALDRIKLLQRAIEMLGKGSAASFEIEQGEEDDEFFIVMDGDDEEELEGLSNSKKALEAVMKAAGFDVTGPKETRKDETEKKKAKNSKAQARDEL
ncbi:hypothetical protein M422DRAFT_275462, partial [Sphaerobolus stellatus SS14]